MDTQSGRIFPGLKDYAREMGMPPDLLVAAFKLENHFHQKLV